MLFVVNNVVLRCNQKIFNAILNLSTPGHLKVEITDADIFLQSTCKTCQLMGRRIIVNAWMFAHNYFQFLVVYMAVSSAISDCLELN